MDDYYLKVGKASDLTIPGERRLYRFFEMLPGLLSWGTLAGSILASWLFPVQTAFFIIFFTAYWLFRSTYLSIHLVGAHRKMRGREKENWIRKLESIPRWKDIYHLVIVPCYKEPYEVMQQSIASLADAVYPKDHMIVVLAIEDRAGSEEKEKAEALSQKFQNTFFRFLVTCHPAHIPGEIAGKGSNEAWASRQAKEQIIDPLNIPYSSVIVSSFDADTVVYPQYFGCLTYSYLTIENPLRTSFQPIPLFFNNIMEASILSRLFSFSATFWQMINQERPEKLMTFSSHSMSFQALVDVGFRQTNVVSDDSRIFWQCFFRYNGDYKVEPLYYPISMDANAAPTLLQTFKQMYKQQRRWAYGVGEIPYFLFGFIKNKAVPLSKKFSLGFELIEGHWAWATAPLLVFVLGWLPLLLGGAEFSQSLLSYNLPRFTSLMLTIGMVGLITSAFISIQLLAPKQKEKGILKLLLMFFQWILLPFTTICFSAFPALDAQARWIFGKYMGFWPTPKFRKPEKGKAAPIQGEVSL
ncbi:MAG: glycosyltransferase family 2 protein [bacterium]|nr:glycosyltransferase family 2 protein [bacterium]